MTIILRRTLETVQIKANRNPVRILVRGGVSSGGGAVASVNGLTGTVVINAGNTANTPAGNVAATTVQAAINELDSEKAGLALANTFSAAQTVAVTTAAAFLIKNTDNGSLGPIFDFDHVSASPVAGDLIGFFRFFARDSGGNSTQYASFYASPTDVTNGSEDATFAIDTIVAGANATQATFGGGVQFGAPTGGAKGTGTLNATEVYNDNVALTCMALATEFREKGTVDLDKWDAMVPDLVIPEKREQVQVTADVVVEKLVDERNEDGDLIRKKVRVTEKLPVIDLDPVWDETGSGVDAIERPRLEEIITPAATVARVHGTARVFKAMVEDGFDPRDPEQYFSKMLADQALPGMPTQADWQHNALGSGEMFSRQWLAQEMQAIVMHAMWAKLQDHEARLTAGGL